MSTKYCILDYETRSECDLKKSGAYEYAKHPTTKILCVSWRLGTKEELALELKNKVKPKIWSPAFSPKIPNDLLSIFTNEDVKLVAHNAFFEQVITAFVLFGVDTHAPVSRWICTAALSAAVAIPRNLEGACLALNLPIQKDMDGRRLILKYCKPRTVYSTWLKRGKKGPPPQKWHALSRDLKRIMLYCQNDVDAETLLFLTLPELNETERKVWELDQKINHRGFFIDQELVDSALKLIDEETKSLNKETIDLSLGKFLSTTQRDGVLAWLESEGVYLPDLRAKTVNDAIEQGLVNGDAKRILQIRKAISKTSTKKYSAFKERSKSNGRVRDILFYHAASTGRWGGSGVQPQNFPRGVPGLDTSIACDVLKSNDLDFIKLIYGDPMEALSSCLRSVIISTSEHEFFCGDYSSIEARVLFWIAKHQAGLKAFYENRPLYEEMAQVIYGVKNVAEVTKAQREVGKRAVLGCGYGMGWKKFLATCQQYNIEIDEITAQMAVKAYRRTHRLVPALWQNLELAAIEATSRPGTKFSINQTKWWVDKLTNGTQILYCELPSKRRLSYVGPQIKYEKRFDDEKCAVLYHWGVDSLSKKWTFGATYGGKLAENVVQAVARDLMAEAMLRLEQAGYEVVLTVHDEILCERLKGQGTQKEFETLMSQLPAWATGCPVTVGGWVDTRYHK